MKKAFINFKQQNLAHLLLIVEFIYQNTKNVAFENMQFKLNNCYYLFAFDKKDINFSPISKSAYILTSNLENFIVEGKKITSTHKTYHQLLASKKQDQLVIYFATSFD